MNMEKQSTRKKKRKYFAMLLAIAIIFSSLPGNILAAENTAGDTAELIGGQEGGNGQDDSGETETITETAEETEHSEVTDSSEAADSTEETDSTETADSTEETDSTETADSTEETVTETEETETEETETDTDSVSGNSVSENSVSGNSVSGNSIMSMEKAIARIGEKEYPSLQKALDSVENGETILLLEDITSSLTTTDKNYTLDMNEHTINAEEDKNVFTISGGEATLKNGTITGGNGSDGAGIHISDSNVNLEKCTVTANTAIYKGGGIYAENSTVILENCSINGNKSTDLYQNSGGGGIYSGNTNLIIKNTTIADNIVPTSNSARGGGIYARGGTLKVTDSAIKDNESAQGSAVLVRELTSFDMEQCTISSNYSRGYGSIWIWSTATSLKNVNVMNNSGSYMADGIAACISNSTQAFRAENCKFNGNQSVLKSGESAMGSAIEIDDRGSDIRFNACEISGNKDMQDTIAISSTENTVFSNCRITGNSASLTGGIHIFDSACVSMSDTVITRNSANGTSYGTGSGGIFLNRGSLTMNSGAIYSNTLTEGTTNADDLMVSSRGGTAKFPAADKMHDGNVDFTKYVWNYINTMDVIKEALTIQNPDTDVYYSTGEHIERKVARIGDTPYFTLAEAVNAADADAVIHLTAGEEDAYGTIFTSNEITIDKSVTIVMDGRTVKATGDRLFTVTKKGSLSLKGGGFADGQIENNGKFFFDGTTDKLDISLGKNSNMEAGDKFEAASVDITLNGTVLAAFNDNKPVDDLILIKGCANAGLASIINITGLDNAFATVAAVGKNIVLTKEIPEGVYLNGSSGNDKNDGLSKQSPVKTFEKAKEILEAGNYDKIFVTGTVNVTKNAEWSLDGKMLQRDPAFTGNLVTIKNGSLTLSDIILDGASRNRVKSTASLIKVNDNGELTLGINAVLRNNVMDKTNRYDYCMGGGIYNQGKMIISGGTIESCTAFLGGGIYCSYGTISMESGTIRNNSAEEIGPSNDHSAGGGVMLAYGAKMHMKGGAIANNTSAYYGGGISLGCLNGSFVYATTPSFEMDGGKIANNQAVTNGGGIFIQMNCEADIRNGHITGNHCSNGYFGGGGIYVNGGKDKSYKNGELRLFNVVISDNTAKIAGGAIAGCPTSKLSIHLSNGGVIYQNNANSAADIFVTSDPNAGYAGEAEAYVSEYMLGGGLYHWMNDNGKELGINYLHNVSDIKAHNDRRNGEDDIERAVGLAKVFITGNTSSTRGGGIGSNGNVTIGESDEETTDISVEKVWSDNNNEGKARPSSIKVWLCRDGEPISFVVISPDVNGTWPRVTFTKQPVKDSSGKEYVYTVKEDSDSLGGIYESDITGSNEDGWIVTNTLLHGFKLEKQVLNDNGNGQKFRFIISLKNSDGTPYQGKLTATDQNGEEKEISFLDGKAEVMLGDAEYLVFKELNKGMEFLVIEEKNSSYTTTTAINGDRTETAAGVIDSGMTEVIFYNTRIPTDTPETPPTPDTPNTPNTPSTPDTPSSEVLGISAAPSSPLTPEQGVLGESKGPGTGDLAPIALWAGLAAAAIAVLGGYVIRRRKKKKYSQI